MQVDVRVVLVEDADVEDAELGSDHEEGLHEQVDLKPRAEPVDAPRHVGDDQQAGDVGREPLRVAFATDRDVLTVATKRPDAFNLERSTGKRARERERRNS